MSTPAPHAPGEFGEPSARTPGTCCGVGHYARKGLKALASLQLTVVLFSFALVLIFFGTVAQMDFGIWTVVEKYFYSWVVWVPTDLIHKFLNVFWKESYPDGAPAWTGSFPLPAGKMLGWLMLLNLLAAHAVRFRLTWKRLGVLTIHSGLILLFVGEFITREHAVEQRMSIDEGQSVNYAQDARYVELVLIDRSDPSRDTEVTIPERMLKKQGRIAHPDLPVDVEVVSPFMVNATRHPPKPGESNPASAGRGRSAIAKEVPEVSGLEENKINLPAVYVRLFKKGTDEELGTYLAALEFYLVRGRPWDTVEVDGKTYELVMRFKRYYKPYRVYLDKFKAERYIGTKKAKEFFSDVRIEDATGALVRQQRIAMNEPLRYGGETFYQGGFDETTEKTTVLQVVKNPGWVLPYVSCIVVGLGLLTHFGIYLVQFLKRLKAPERVALTGSARYLPWAVLVVAVLYLLSIPARMGPPKEPPGLDAAARLPVVEGGRLKPLDTLARVNLRLISGREEFEDETGKKQPAIRWYLETLAGGSDDERGPVWKYKVFRVDNEQVLRELGLAPREGLRYSMEELWPNLARIKERAAEAHAKEERIKEERSNEKLDKTEVKYKELEEKLGRFRYLSEFGGPQLPPRDGEERWVGLREFRGQAAIQEMVVGTALAHEKLAPKLAALAPEDEAKLMRALRVDPAELPPKEFARIRQRVIDLITADPSKLGPGMRPVWLQAARVLLAPADDRAVGDAMRAEYRKQLAAHPMALAWEDMVTAYREKRDTDFARALDECRGASTAGATGRDLNRATVELFLDRFAPFYQCTGLYVLAFVLSVVGFTQYAAQRPQWGFSLRRAATGVLLLTFTLHTLALFGRMYVMDRPMVFVTNLYASAVFIGWGCVALGLVLERIFPVGVGNVLASILGLATTIVAHNIAADDTMEMVVAVLDTNSWLATHVTTVTLGYTATFVAGFLGAFYVFQMLGAVIRDSFQSTGEPTVGALLAFGVAVTGVVGIPLLFLWFMTDALIKFELLPKAVLDGIFWLLVAGGVMYALALMLLRVGSEGVDAHGKPVAGQVPNIAKPVVALALTPERSKTFGQMVYGVVCFATLLSFVGTVLGGIWADQSWGRFWGWDPKENGAVLIVLWNSLILHARWCGLVKDRGIAVLAIFGNVMTAWSWFGTNQLSIGLHAYGFDSRLADGVFNFWLSQLFILSWGLIPQQFWAGARRTAPAAAQSAAPNAQSALNPNEPTANGHALGTNGQAPAAVAPNGNGQPNGQPRHRKGKKRDRK
jgi:ABC-type transport system involved in cytochrome c biogenesis permease subunit